MNYYVKELRWLINAFTLTLEELDKLFDKGSYLPFELIEHYESIVDIEMSNIKQILTSDELERFKPLHNYLYHLMMSEKYTDSWYDNNFINSNEWLAIKELANNYMHFMNWKLDIIQPLYSEIIYINDGKSHGYITMIFKLIDNKLNR